MRKAILLCISMLCIYSLFGQQNQVKLYNPNANAIVEIENAVKKASSGQKHVLIQVGGNWCPWCIKLHQFVKDNATIDSILQADYVVVHVNYSKENKNTEVMKKLENPQRFGFPVLVFLNTEGKRIHTQDTGLLEHNKSYSPKKVLNTLKNWNYSALHYTE